MQQSVTCFAQNSLSPTSILQQHEQHLRDLMFDWQLTQSVAFVGSSQQSEAIVMNQIAGEVRKEDERQGITDEATVQEHIKQRQQDISSAEQGYFIQTTKTWRFADDGKLTSVTGENQNSPSYAGKFGEFYGHNYGLIVNDYSKDPQTGKAGSTSEPNIWGCSGDCVRYRSPFENGLSLKPEDFVILMGKNPLAMYDAKWSLISDTPSSLVYSTQVAEGNHSPFSISIALDKQHSDQVARLQIVGLGNLKWSFDYNVKRYSQWQGQWVCAEAESSYNQHTITIKRHWLLQGIQPSAPISVSVPATDRISDYRLLGDNLTMDDITEADERHNPKVVTYAWTGEVPSQEKLKKIYKDTHPSNARLDKSDVMGLAVGLICVTCGLLTYRRRVSGTA